MAGMIKTHLVKAINKLSELLQTKLPAAGLHEVAHPWPALITVSEYGERYYLMFAILAAPGVRLRFVVELEKDLDHVVLERAATQTVKVVGQARASRTYVLGQVRAAEANALDAFASEEGVESHATFIGARLAPVRVDLADQPLRVEIGYEGLNERIQVTRDMIRVEDPTTVPEALQPVFTAQGRRATNRRLADEAGGVGLMDAVTLRAVTALERDPQAFLRRFIRGENVLLTVGTPLRTGSSYAMQWKDGVAGARLQIDDDCSFGQGQVSVRGVDRRLDPAALAGKPIRCLVEHSLLPADLVVKEARWDEGWPHLLTPVEHHRLIMSYVAPLHAFDHNGRMLT